MHLDWGNPYLHQRITRVTPINYSHVSYRGLIPHWQLYCHRARTVQPSYHNCFREILRPLCQDLEFPFRFEIWPRSVHRTCVATYQISIRRENSDAHYRGFEVFLQYIMTRFRTILWSMTRDFIYLDVSIWMILSVWSPTMHKHNMNTGNTRVPTSTMQAFTNMRTRVPPGRVQRIAANTQPKQAQSRSLAAETKWERQSSGGQRLSDVINTQLLRRS